MIGKMKDFSELKIVLIYAKPSAMVWCQNILEYDIMT
jgi:hypothetical protein